MKVRKGAFLKALDIETNRLLKKLDTMPLSELIIFLNQYKIPDKPLIEIKQKENLN